MKGMSDTVENAPAPERPRKLNLRTIEFEEQQRRAARAKAERDAREAAEKKRAEFTMKVAVAEKLTDKLPRDGMAPVFFAAARRVAMEVLLGNIPIRNGAEAGAAIKALVDAGRLETGGSTVPADDDITKPPVNREEAERRLKLIQDEVAKRRAEVNQASGE